MQPDLTQWALAEQLAGRLGRISGVHAVTLGGSLARGRGHAGSDIDLGIYYRPDAAPDLGALRALVREVNDGGSDDTVSGTAAGGAGSTAARG